MNKGLIILILNIVISFSALASTQWQIVGSRYDVDTTYHATIGPGITETHLTMSNSSHRANLYVATIDITNPYNDIRVITAGDTVFGLSSIPQLAESHDNSSIKHIVGTNADFAQIGNYKVPAAGYVVSDAELIGCGGGYADDFSSYFYYSNLNPCFAREVNVVTTLHLPSGANLNVSINKNRGENDAILYNSRQGHFTGTNEWGAERILKVADGNSNFSIGASVQLEVVSEIDYAGNMSIPDDGYVLSCHGSSIPFLQQMHVGDKIAMNSKILIDGLQATTVPSQLVGGSPVILKSGVVDSLRIDDANKHLGHLNNNEPRTAIGVSEDKTTLYLVVIDGRIKGVSEGVTAKALGHIMRHLGCHNAMNCDGGGSSQFYVRKLTGPRNCRVRNTPVGGTYCRPVSNGIFAVTNTPNDNVITRIEIREKQIHLSTGESYTPVVYGYNKYGVLIDTDVKNIKIRVAREVGTVEGTTFVPGNYKYNTDFTVLYGDLSHTIPMYLNGGGMFVSAIDTVFAEETDSEPEYYTLQGIRIYTPVSGQLVVVRRGAQFSKEIFR